MSDNPFESPGWPYRDADQPAATSGEMPSAHLPPAEHPPPPVPSAAVPPPPQRGAVPPPPPPRVAPVSSRRIWLVLGCVVVALAVAVGACTVWLISAVRPPVDRSNAFLAAIDEGDYAAAAAMIDPDCGNGLSSADLQSFFGGADLEYDLNSSSVSSINGSDTTAQVSGALRVGASSERITIALVKRGEVWFVCGFSVR